MFHLFVKGVQGRIAVQCDECEEVCEESGMTHEEADKVAAAGGWRRDGDMHYCPECDDGWVDAQATGKGREAMANALDSLIVLRGQPGCKNPTILSGEKCTVRHFEEPEAEEQTFSRVDLATMKATPASDIIERKRGAVELSIPYHSFAWGVKRNGRDQGRWSSKHIRIAADEHAAEVRETHATMIAAMRAHQKAKERAWNNAKPTTAAAAKRLATDWPEANQKVL